MPAEILQSSLAVAALASGGNSIIPHGLTNRGIALVPNIVLPDRATALVVTAVDATNVTFNNPGPAAETFGVCVDRRE